jgi:hypothetical protein
MATTRQGRKSSSATKVKGKGAKAPGGSRRPQAAGRKNKPDASSTPRVAKPRGAGTPAAQRDATTSARAGRHASGGGVTFRDGTKGSTIVGLLKLKNGATIAELTKATGWQAHSVRGFLSGALKEKVGLTIASEKGDDGERRYRIAP